MRTLLPFLLALALSGCAPFSGPPAMPDIRAQLTPDRIARLPGPALLAELPARQAAAILAPTGENGGVTTWGTADGVSLSFRGGVIVATRGLGFDLMAADVSGTLAALSGGPADRYTRRAAFLDGENQTVLRAFLCRLGPPAGDSYTSVGRTHQAVRRTETCTSSDGSVENEYWIDGDGTIARSRQWVGPELGYLTAERLK